MGTYKRNIHKDLDFDFLTKVLIFDFRTAKYFHSLLKTSIEQLNNSNTFLHHPDDEPERQQKICNEILVSEMTETIKKFEKAFPGLNNEQPT